MILGPLAILVAWTAYLIIYFGFDRGGHYTLSSIGASRKKTYAIFATGTFLAGILVFVFIRNWFVDALMLPSLFLQLAGVAALFLQPIMAFVPRTEGYTRRIHDVAAYIEAGLLPLMGLFIARSPVLPLLVSYICMLLVIFMLYLFFEFKKRFLKTQFIYIQALYFGSFHLVILLATFTAWSRQR